MAKQVKIIEPQQQLIDQQKNKLRVAAYARVSTANAGQSESFENQVYFYTEKIKANSNWDFVGVYADKAISGTTTKRPQFLKLIDDCELGKVDLILTKSISRFSRNIADLMNYVRKLKDLHVDIIFEEDHIQLSDDKSGLLLSILGAIAQMEVENTSSHLNWTIQEKMKAGKHLGISAALGYDIAEVETEDDKAKQLVINKEEAKIVKFIFDEYLSGKGTHAICKELNSIGIKTKKGNTIWKQPAVIFILKNEVYIGTLIQGKTVTTSTMEHKRAWNNGLGNKYIIENNHEPIISLEDFQRVQEQLKLRKNERTNKGTTKNSGRSLFTSKIFCYYCGKNYLRRTTHSRTKYAHGVWQCATYVYEGRSHCLNSKSIKEEDIKEAFVVLLNQMLNDENSIFNIDENIFNSYLKKQEQSISNDSKKNSLEKNLKKLEKDKTQLLDFLLDGTISKDEYKTKSENIDEQIENIETQLEQINHSVKIEEERIRNIEEARELVKKNDVSIFSKELFDRVVDRIIIGGERLNENNELIDDPKLLTFKLKTEFLKIDDLYSFDNNTRRCFYGMYTRLNDRILKFEI